MTISALDLQKALIGLHYPAARRELVQHAEQIGAPDEVRTAIARLPDRDYQGPRDVSEALLAT